MRSAVVPIVPAGSEPAVCGGCGDAAAPACGALRAGRCDEPDLRGDSARLGAALRALDAVQPMGDGRGLRALRWIRALVVDSNEAELVLTVAPVCGESRIVADQALRALQRALPDTDLYVRHQPD